MTTAADRPVALITGGTRGIGRAIADALAPDHRLLIGGRDPFAATAVAHAYPDAGVFAADLADLDAVREAASQVERVDVLVHSAGIVDQHVIEDATVGDWERILRINVIAVAELTRVLLPQLRESPTGLVVAINSGSGFRSGVGSGLYSASKFALRAFTDALREEERGRVRVASVHPGRVATDMQREMWAELGDRSYADADHLDPADVAAAVRVIVDADPRASIDELSIRPAVGRNPER